MQIIQQPIEELSIPPKVTIGDRTRNSTCTGVRFIDDNTIITASFNSKTLYLLKYINEKWEIIDRLKTKINNDLIDYKDGIIACSGYPFSSSTGYLGLYKIENDKILSIKDIPLPNTKAHGVEIIDEWSVIITSNSDHNRGCLFISTDTEKVVKNFNEFELYPKDCIIRDNRLLIVCARSLPQIGQKTIIKESKVYLFSYPELKKLDEITFHGQTDSITLSGENGFITVQGDDSVVHFTLKKDKLTYIKRIEGFNFPHGIDSFNKKLAVTNYGTNQILIFDINELI